MSTDWEKTLASWIKPASDSEETKRENTEKLIRAALNEDSNINGLPFKVKAKGSYANSTNVRLDSDVDVNVQYQGGIFYYDFTHSLKGKTGADFGWTGTDGEEPTPSEFKDLVESSMKKAFGTSSVTRRNKAIEVERSNLLAADVVPCFTYHRYERLDSSGSPVPTKGTKLFPDTGLGIINWPEQHYENGVWKRANTKERFKKMVRCLKRLENVMVEKGVVKETPSYLIECLVWNVPNEHFGHPTLLADFRAILMTIFNATLSDERCSEWSEVNDLKYLFRGSQKWTRQDAHQLAAAAWDYVGFD